MVFFLYHNMFDAATLAAERVQAPDPEVPVVSHIYLHGVNEITATGAALPSIEVRHVNLRGLGTVSTSTAAAPDPEVPVVNHVYGQGMDNVLLYHDMVDAERVTSSPDMLSPD